MITLQAAVQCAHNGHGPHTIDQGRSHKTAGKSIATPGQFALRQIAQIFQPLLDIYGCAYQSTHNNRNNYTHGVCCTDGTGQANQNNAKPKSLHYSIT